MYSSPMTVSVLLFASWSDALGSQLELELPAGARVADLLAALSALTAGKSLPRPLVALNQRYAKPEAVIAEGDEIAIIPPVAGG